MAEHTSQTVPMALAVVDGMSIDVATTIDETTAAKRMQRFWRWCRFFSLTALIIRKFQSQGLSSDEVRAIRSDFPFDEKLDLF